MDGEELEPLRKKSKPRDLTVMSIEDLEDYIQTLSQEIERTKNAIKAKQSARMGAESVFK
ncbi:MAG: DUF1192 domain-containing protein [Rhodospirillaceae bacterium]|jgi:uncharacterized small protein (DUF1192 family)